MGLLGMVLGNATEVDLNAVKKEFEDILVEGEELEHAYSVVRDKWVFTTKRLILLDVQGLTGAKKEYLSIPYENISYFSVETAGTLDDDCEMKIWVKGAGGCIQKEFSRKTDIKAIQRNLAAHILR
ncbi:MAG: PH domain-containing protein [Paludibacteraceae bacterium]|nr:PH domain-containing protein [Paludibacteraceae bacterium]